MARPMNLDHMTLEELQALRARIAAAIVKKRALAVASRKTVKEERISR
jgi:hypothetical protein